MIRQAKWSQSSAPRHRCDVAVPHSSKRVLVFHPGRQHSHQLAWALEEAGLLGLYVYGSPLPPSALVAIPASRRRFVPLAPIGRRLSRVWPGLGIEAQAGYLLDRAFDHLIARSVPVELFNAVIGYENASRAVFARAKRAGVATILDAASIHHIRQDQLCGFEESAAFHAGVTARKDAEIALADVILTCSALAKDTYIAAGVEPRRLHVMALGADIPAAHAHAHALHAGLRPASGPPRFLFVGRLTAHKGIDLLIEAIEVAHSAGHAFSLTIVADQAGASPALLARLRSIADLRGPMPPQELASLYAASDCLVLPSRFDSFGLVVPEALSHGCCAIVSTGAGAAMLIADGENGLTFPIGDAAAFHRCIVSVITGIGRWRSRRPAVRDAARAYDWRHYRARIIAFACGRLDAASSSEDEALMLRRTGV